MLEQQTPKSELSLFRDQTTGKFRPMAEVEDGPKFPAERSNRRDFPDTKEEFEVDGPKGSKGVGGSKHHHH